MRPYWLTLVMLIGLTTGVRGHPHHWVDVFATWQFDAAGLITGVHLRWLFDDYYSILLLDDAKASGEKLPTIRDRILNNVQRYDYFLNVEQAGSNSKTGAAEEAGIAMRDHRVEVSFQLPLRTALDPRQADVIYRIAEPTYFFEMLHAEEGPAIVLDNAPRTCRYHLDPPRPDAALVAYAASLGINESGGDELGIQFAETVTIRCE